MNTTPADLSVESIEAVLVEKEAALAKEQAMIEGLRALLSRMGYELVPAGTGRRPRGGRTIPNLSITASSTPTGAKRGRPRKDASAATQSGEPGHA
jgi:hypothetical protein